MKADKNAQAQLIKKPLVVGGETVVFNFSAEYLATGIVEPGLVVTQVPFSIDYQ